MQQIRTPDGLLNSPPSGEASHAAWDGKGQPILKQWHRDDKKHRENGPASIWYNTATGVHEVEAHYLDGKKSVDSKGRYIIRRDGVSGEITKEEYPPSAKRNFPPANSGLVPK